MGIVSNGVLFYEDERGEIAAKPIETARGDDALEVWAASCRYCNGWRNRDPDNPYWLDGDLNDVGQQMGLGPSHGGEPCLRFHAESEDGSYRHETWFGPIRFCPWCGGDLSR